MMMRPQRKPHRKRKVVKLKMGMMKLKTTMVKNIGGQHALKGQCALAILSFASITKFHSDVLHVMSSCVVFCVDKIPFRCAPMRFILLARFKMTPECHEADTVQRWLDRESFTWIMARQEHMSVNEAQQLFDLQMQRLPANQKCTQQGVVLQRVKKRVDQKKLMPFDRARSGKKGNNMLPGAQGQTTTAQRRQQLSSLDIAALGARQQYETAALKDRHLREGEMMAPALAEDAQQEESQPVDDSQYPDSQPQEPQESQPKKAKD